MLWLLIGYMFLFIHRPFEIWPVLGTFHIERIYILMVALSVAAWPGKYWIKNKQHFAYLAFAFAVLVCWIFSPWGPACETIVENYFKMLVFFILVILVVHDERDLRRLVTGFMVVFCIYLLHSLREYASGRLSYQMGINRMVGVDSSMGDPNSFGISIALTLPFVTPLWLSSRSLTLRFFLVAYVGLAVLCIALTGSRSAFVGVIFCAFMEAIRSRARWQWALVGLVLAPFMWAALPSELQTRFTTIVDPEVGPKNAQTSAQGRIDGLLTGLRLWEEYPITGCGPGAWRPASGSRIESHNLYGQVLGEMGTLGTLTFAAIVLGFWSNLRWLRKAYRTHPEWRRDFVYYVAQAVWLAVLLLLLEGNLAHNLFRYNWIWYGGFLIIACHCVQQRLEARTARPLPLLVRDGTFAFSPAIVEQPSLVEAAPGWR